MEKMVSDPALYLHTGPRNRVITNTRMRKIALYRVRLFIYSIIANWR